MHCRLQIIINHYPWSQNIAYKYRDLYYNWQWSLIIIDWLFIRRGLCPRTGQRTVSMDPTKSIHISTQQKGNNKKLEDLFTKFDFVSSWLRRMWWECYHKTLHEKWVAGEPVSGNFEFCLVMEWNPGAPQEE